MTSGLGRAGAVGVEMALVAAMLTPMIVGMVDAGQMVRGQQQLNQSVRSALFYAWANNGAVTAANVQTVAAAAYGSASVSPPTVTATITQYCITPATGYPATGTPPQPSSGSCPTGQSVETYLYIKASIAFSPIFTVSYIATGGTLSVVARARIL